MRKLFISGNWKMNTIMDQALELVDEIIKGLGGTSGVDIVICPPFVFIDRAVEQARSGKIQVGAQNVFYRGSGAYTGEISPAMLRSIGCTHVIVGHSERRSYFNESDTDVNKKIRISLAHGLIPIFCVGETLEQRNEGQTFDVLNHQLVYGLEGIDDTDIQTIIIAYEPVWAIGTGRSATGQQAEETHIFIRDILSNFTGSEVAEKIRIIYGGSVTPANAHVLLAQENIDGALIGGASLISSSFCEIVRTALSLSRG